MSISRAKGLIQEFVSVTRICFRIILSSKSNRLPLPYAVFIIWLVLVGGVSLNNCLAPCVVINNPDGLLQLLTDFRCHNLRREM